MQIIDGQVLADKIKDEIVKDILEIKDVRPNLAIILVGEREDSKLYVGLKEKEAVKVGIDTHLYKLPESTTDQEILEIIQFLNNDEMIDAILVQLPLPEHLDTDAIILSIKPEKDVDGFHPDNLDNLYHNRTKKIIMPPVFDVVLEILDSIKFDLTNKNVSIIANSEIFGKSLAKVLKVRGANATMIDSRKEISIDMTDQADVLISAVGRPHFIKKEMVKEDAVIIDIGICKENGKTCGDVDFEDVKDKVSFITPVPGGVGPLTIAMAFKNTLDLYKRRNREK